MRKLDFNEYKLCQLQAKLFEKSIVNANFSSPMFIRRFMTSEYAKTFIDMSYLVGNITEDEILNELNNKYLPSTKNPMYTMSEMYWIGYIYASMAFLYELSPKQVYKLFPAKEIVKYYNIYHTFGIEEASERMMENIGYKKIDYTQKGVEILRRLYYIDELKKIIGKEVIVNLQNNGMLSYFEKIEKIKKGILKDFYLKDKQQEAYVYGYINEGENNVSGKVVGIVQKEDESIVIVVPENIDYKQKEFEKTLLLCENVTKYKIIK